MTMNFGRTARVISVTSGKGGVGKTSIAANLSVALSRAGKRTLLADCDLGMANAAILLGMNPSVTIDDVLEGRLSADEVIAERNDGLFILPGGSGTGTMPAFGSKARQRLADGLRPWSRMVDVMIVDTPTGGSQSTMEMTSAADMILLVLSGEPTAFMDAYATVKMLTLDHGARSISVIVNMVESEAEGRILFQRFQDVASRFLPSQLNFLGSVPNDRHMRDAVLHKRVCIEAYPQSRASAAFGRLAASLSDLNLPTSLGGNRFFGMETARVAR